MKNMDWRPKEETILNWRWWAVFPFLLCFLVPIAIFQGCVKLLIKAAGATRNWAIRTDKRINKIMSAPMKRLQNWTFRKTPNA